MSCVRVFQLIFAILTMVLLQNVCDASLAYMRQIMKQGRSHLAVSIPSLPRSMMENAAEYVKFTPKRKNLREKRLVKIMGNSFDAQWMSVDEPTENRYAISAAQQSSKQDEKLLMDLKKLNFTFWNSEGQVFDVKPQLQEIMKTWLLQAATCPIRYIWEDIGVMFWPRWIKRGICDDKKTCSWPPGMHCVPAASKNIYVLRWHCRRRRVNGRRRGSRGRKKQKKNALSIRLTRSKDTERRTRSKPNHNKRRRMSCKWLKVPYPVTQECFCSC